MAIKIEVLGRNDMTPTGPRSAATLALLTLFAAPAAGETIDQLYAAAKSEGELVIYGGGPATWYDPWTKEFEQAFPGVKVTAKAGSSNVHADEIDAQTKAGKRQVDMAILQTVQDYERWKKAGLLLAFQPEGFEQIDAAYKDKDGAYVGITVHGISYNYNTQKVAAGAVPKSALDFLKPEFKGKIITTYPHVDDVTLYLYETIVEKYGADFLTKLKANEPAFVRGHLGVARAVASGEERTLTFDAFINMTLAEANAGKPTAIAVSEVDPMPTYAQIAGIFKDAPHPNAAKLYLSWYLQPEQQKRQGTWSSRADVVPPAPLKPLASYRLANRFRDFVMDERRMQALREKYLGFTGPITNTGVYR
jgi:ABC-type Fe3+ transport system substrate-binding protein